MPSVTYDGRSFMLDGRRVWLVGGSIHYARVPRDEWAGRIHLARQAGLNTIAVPVFWARHEPRSGAFDFKGDNDLRHFVELIGAAGLHCILRPGPYVGAAWDNGGLPAWLAYQPNVLLRSANGPFLEACSRYLTAVVEEVRDLQVTSPGKGGPIVLVQNECAWTCGDEKKALGYLGELDRYLREAGVTVPIVSANNLWQEVEGEIDGWRGRGDLMPTVRQLAAVRPAQPRVVGEFGVGTPTLWGAEPEIAESGALLERRLAQVLAAGGQFVVEPFCGGTNFGFSAGRRADLREGFVAATFGAGAPVDEMGRRGPAYHAVRRVCTFASRFGRVLANLDPTYRPVVASPAAEGAPEGEAAGTCSVVHAAGTQGGVVFVFAPPGEGVSGRSVSLLLPDGSSVPVSLGAQGVVWCLLDVMLGGRATLDYANVSVLGVAGRTIACFGPAGSMAHLSINGSPIQAPVPRGRQAAVVAHEGHTLVVCNEEQAETTFVADEAVWVGVSGLGADGKPIALPGARQALRVDGAGAAKAVTIAPVVVREPARVAPGDWSVAGCEDYVAGTSARFAAIDGPADLGVLGSPYGCGWYRIRFRSPSARKVRLAFPLAADRLHVWLDGEALGVAGVGPGAAPEVSASLRAGAHTMVVLAENLGRASGGASLGEAKGLYGHVWEVKALRAGKPALKLGTPVDVLAFRSPLWEVASGDLTLPERVTWALAHRRRTPIILGFDSAEWGALRALLLLNNKPVAYVDRGASGPIVLEPERLSRGTNVIQLALLGEPAGPEAGAAERALAVLAPSVTLLEGVAPLSQKAQWAFARWEAPGRGAYERGKGEKRSNGPTWWKTTFTPGDDRALAFEATGMTKGQLYVNGRHLGRYFVALRTGRVVPGQSRYHIPASWVRAGAENELLVFDEHGGEPARTRLVQE